MRKDNHIENQKFNGNKGRGNNKRSNSSRNNTISNGGYTDSIFKPRNSSSRPERKNKVDHAKDLIAMIDRKVFDSSSMISFNNIDVVGEYLFILNTGEQVAGTVESKDETSVKLNLLIQDRIIMYPIMKSDRVLFNDKSKDIYITEIHKLSTYYIADKFRPEPHDNVKTSFKFERYRKNPNDEVQYFDFNMYKGEFINLYYNPSNKKYHDGNPKNIFGTMISDDGESITFIRYIRYKDQRSIKIDSILKSDILSATRYLLVYGPYDPTSMSK